MQFAQSGSDSTARNDPSSRVWPQSVVTGPPRGTLGVRWIRPPVFRRTDSRRTLCTPKSWVCFCLAALIRLRVADAGGARLAHALLLEGFVIAGRASCLAICSPPGGLWAKHPPEKRATRGNNLS